MLSISDEDLEPYKGDYPFDLLAGKQFICVYTDIVDCQYVGESKQRLKNGNLCEDEPTHRIVLSNLEYKNFSWKFFSQLEFN